MNEIKGFNKKTNAKNIEDFKFNKFSDFAIRHIGGIRHIMMSDINSGMLIGLKSRYIDKSIDYSKISSIMSHFFFLNESEFKNKHELKISINELETFKIFSTRINDRVISLITDTETNIGLIRMLIQRAFRK
ncbi:MAG: hypothetical protein ACTSRZ_15050 [Promethearchaeota archaeon]